MSEQFDKDGFFDRLKEFAKKSSMKQKDLAAILGVTEQSMSTYLKKRENAPNIDKLFRLAKAGCDINWLLTGESLKKAETVISNNSNTTVAIDGNANDNEAVKLALEVLNRHLKSK